MSEAAEARGSTPAGLHAHADQAMQASGQQHAASKRSAEEQISGQEGDDSQQGDVVPSKRARLDEPTSAGAGLHVAGLGGAQPGMMDIEEAAGLATASAGDNDAGRGAEPAVDALDGAAAAAAAAPQPQATATDALKHMQRQLDQLQRLQQQLLQQPQQQQVEQEVQPLDVQWLQQQMVQQLAQLEQQVMGRLQLPQQQMLQEQQDDSQLQNVTDQQSMAEDDQQLQPQQQQPLEALYDPEQQAVEYEQLQQQHQGDYDPELMQHEAQPLQQQHQEQYEEQQLEAEEQEQQQQQQHTPGAQQHELMQEDAHQEQQQHHPQQPPDSTDQELEHSPQPPGSVDQQQQQQQQQLDHAEGLQVHQEQHEATDGAVTVDTGGDDAGGVATEEQAATATPVASPAAAAAATPQAAAARPEATPASGEKRGRRPGGHAHNFLVQLDMTSGTNARTRKVTPQGKGPRGGDAAPRVLGRGPAVAAPTPLFQNHKPADADTRSVTLQEQRSGRPSSLKVVVSVHNPASLYLHAWMGKAIPDPCVTDVHYEEGIRRMNQFLDAGAMREIMGLHFELRIPPTVEFGHVNLSNIRNKQAWLITNFRNAKGKTVHDMAFSRTYTLGCYRVTALLQSREMRQMMDLLPLRKKKFLVFTLGQVDYWHLEDGPQAFFRTLLHNFTPPDLVASMVSIQPLPGPTPRGNISVTPRAWPPLNTPRGSAAAHGAGEARGRGAHGSGAATSGSGGHAGQGGRPRERDGRGQRGSGRERDRERSRERDRGPMEGPPAAERRGAGYNDGGGRMANRNRGLPGPPPGPDLGPPGYGPGSASGPGQPHSWGGRSMGPAPAGSRDLGRQGRSSSDLKPDLKGQPGWGRAEPGYGDRGGVGGYRYGEPQGGPMRGGGTGSAMSPSRPLPGPPGSGRPSGTVPPPRPPPGPPPPGNPPPQQQQQQLQPDQPASAQAGLELVLQAALQQQQLQQLQQLLPAAGAANPLADVMSLLTGSLGLAPAAAAGNPQAALLQQLQGLAAATAPKPPAAAAPTDAAAAVAAALALQQQASLQQQVQQQMQQIQALQAQLQQQQQQPAPPAAGASTAKPAAPAPPLGPAPTGQPSAPPSIANASSGPTLPAPQPAPPRPQGLQAGPPPALVGAGPGMPPGARPAGPHAPDAGAALARMGGPPGGAPRLVLRAAAGSTPAPWRAALPAGSVQAMPQDARCMGTFSFAVADGVAATRQLGIDSGPWAQSLAEAAVAVADAAVLNAQRAGRPVMRPQEVLAAALERVHGSGAASCCIMYLAGKEVLIGKVGPCGGVVLRSNRAIGEMEAVSRWQPYRDSAERSLHLASPDLGPLVGAAPPATAQEERLAVEPGDILVLGTHGLFDMVWFHGPPSSNLLRELYALGHSQQVDPQVVANQLSNLAASMGASGALSGSPLSLQLSKEGRAPIPMQDVGDNCAILVYVSA